MRDIFLSIAAFFLAVIFHISWCRCVKRNGLQVRAFFMIAVGLLCIKIAIELSTSPATLITGSYTVWTMPLKFTADIIYLLLGLFYLICYFSPRVESPSQRLLRTCSKADGSTLEELEKAVNNDDFIMTRMDDLLRCGYMRVVEGHYEILPPAIFVARVLVFYQKISGRGIGG